MSNALNSLMKGKMSWSGACLAPPCEPAIKFDRRAVSQGVAVVVAVWVANEVAADELALGRVGSTLR